MSPYNVVAPTEIDAVLYKTEDGFWLAMTKMQQNLPSMIQNKVPCNMNMYFVGTCVVLYFWFNHVFITVDNIFTIVAKGCITEGICGDNFKS